MSQRNPEPLRQTSKWWLQSAVLLFIVAAILPHVYKLTLPPLELGFRLMSDDAFYYFKTALNISKGLGSTFDSYNFTNGYHPLWMFLCVATAFVTRDLHEYVRLIMAVNLAVVILLSIQVYRMTLSCLGPVFAGLLLCLINWPFSGTFRLFNGLETALFLFLVLVNVQFIVNGSFKSHKEWSLLGVSLGAAFLARTSFILFAPVLAGYLVFRHVRGDLKITLSAAICLMVPVCVLVLPYLAWNYVETGHFEQISGLVKNYWSGRTSRSPSDYLHTTLLFGGILWSNVGVYTRSVDRWLLFSLNIALGLSIVCVGYFRRVSFLSLFRDERMLLLTGMAVIELCYYYFSYFDQVRHWHLALPVLVLQFAFVLLLKRIYESLPEQAWSKAAFAAVVAVIWGLHLVWLPVDLLERKDADKVRFTERRSDIQTADWLRTNVRPNAKIGGANVGRIGYFSDRNVVNLDGIINGSDFLNYLVRGKGRLSYIVDKRIQYVIPDVPNIVDIPTLYGHPVERLSIGDDAFVYRIRYRSPRDPFGKDRR